MAKLNIFKLKAARKLLQDAGLGVGDLVTVKWQTNSPSGGEYTASHTGVISSLDDWIKIEESSKSPGYLYLPLTGLLHVELEVPSDASATVPA